MAFLEAALAAAAGRPVAMFTHAPPLGSGLKVLQVWCPHHKSYFEVSRLPLRKIDEESFFLLVAA